MLTQVNIHASFRERYVCGAEDTCVDGCLRSHDGGENGCPKYAAARAQGAPARAPASLSIVIPTKVGIYASCSVHNLCGAEESCVDAGLRRQDEWWKGGGLHAAARRKAPAIRWRGHRRATTHATGVSKTELSDVA